MRTRAYRPARRARIRPAAVRAIGAYRCMAIWLVSQPRRLSSSGNPAEMNVAGVMATGVDPSSGAAAAGWALVPPLGLGTPPWARTVVAVMATAMDAATRSRANRRAADIMNLQGEEGRFAEECDLPVPKAKTVPLYANAGASAQPVANVLIKPSS